MNMIRKSLLQLIFSGSYLQRWNDKLRPVDLQEMDKQAHKMILAFILWQCQPAESNPEKKLELGLEVIEGGLFEYFYRLVITDIKPPIFYRIKENREHYRELTRHVLSVLEPMLRPLDAGFWKRMAAWHDGDRSSGAARILDAAHLYASNWEFSLIKPLNGFDSEMTEIEHSFNVGLDSYRDLPGMPAILDNKDALAAFARMSGMLRFQIRWTQVPRIPATSVLGHMFLVACYAYFFSLVSDYCRARRINNFFCGLFHDLPELLTRDIISPVKHSVSSLPDIIKQYEEEELHRRILDPLRASGHDRLAVNLEYYLGLPTGSEFHYTVRNASGKVTRLEAVDMAQNNSDEFDPKDGGLVKLCDMLAAFMEAHSTIRNGVSSPQIVEAVVRLRGDIRQNPLAEALNLGALLTDFD